MFEISFIPAFKDNYIWLLTQGSRAFVVDPGDAAPVLARLESDGLRLEGILITHHHADHQGGIAALKSRYQTEVFAPAGESITGCTHPLRGGESIEVLGQKVDVMAGPGHTLGHIAYHAPGAKASAISSLKHSPRVTSHFLLTFQFFLPTSYFLLITSYLLLSFDRHA